MPYVFGGISHLLPLMVFQHNYISQIKGLNNYFLAESSKHRILKNLGMKDLPFDYSIKKEHDANVTSQLNYIGKQIKSIEENAIRYLNPDYLLEDFDYNSTELSLKYNIPRISIQRSGYFNCRSAQDNNIRHMHSLEKLSEGKSIFRHVKTTESSPVVGILEEHSNNCIKIIPGIPSIEQKPSCLLDESKYFYCGPLIVKDRPTDTLKTNLAKFYSRHTLKKRVFITTGAFESSSIDRYINILLDRNYAIVTNECKINHNSIFTKKILPVDYICSQSDLIIHHCGSGMYHIPILNEKPSITIGTQCFDREIIASRLAELGISKHTPSRIDNINYLKIFNSNLDLFESESLTNMKRIKELKNEIIKVKSNFNLSAVLNS